MKYLYTSLIVLGVVLVLGLIAIDPLITYGTKDQVHFTVKDKQNIVRSKDSYYLIFTDNGVYQDSDSLWYWKWNSSDVYGNLEVGKTYDATVYGFRVPFLSWYKNIVKIN